MVYRLSYNDQKIARLFTYISWINWKLIKWIAVYFSVQHNFRLFYFTFLGNITARGAIFDILALESSLDNSLIGYK